VITSTEPRFSAEQQQDMAASEALKGPEVAAIKEQQKASQIMAEHLPGLSDPNAPAPAPASTPASGKALPGQDKATPPEPPAPKLLHPLRPDRFTPGAKPQPSQSEESSPPAHPGRNPKP
jgi:rod shape-determining protein MreC